MQLLRIPLRILISFLAGVVAYYCFGWLFDPPEPLRDNSVAFSIYWRLLLVAAGIFAAAITLTGIAAAIGWLLPVHTARQLRHIADRALHAAHGLCGFLLAIAMAVTCTFWVFELHRQWDHNGTHPLLLIVVQVICAVVWGVLSMGWALRLIAVAALRFLPRRFPDDPNPPQPPRRPFNGDPVPAPRGPHGPKSLQAHAIPPQG